MNQLVPTPPALVACAGEPAGMRLLEFFAANNRVSLPLSPKPRHLSDVAAAVVACIGSTP